MAQRPSYRPLEPSSSFVDEASARPLVQGTVPRGQPLDDAPLVKGRKESALTEKPGKLADYVTTFPFSITEEGLKRGQARYTIFCAVCHGPLGNGNGRILESRYPNPPSHSTEPPHGFYRWGFKEPLAAATVGHVSDDL